MLSLLLEQSWHSAISPNKSSSSPPLWILTDEFEPRIMLLEPKPDVGHLAQVLLELATIFKTSLTNFVVSSSLMKDGSLPTAISNKLSRGSWGSEPGLLQGIVVTSMPSNLETYI